MDMIGYLGKKVDLICHDGGMYSGYVFDVLEEDASDLGKACIELDPLEQEHLIEIPIEEIKSISVDQRYKEFDFRR